MIKIDEISYVQSFIKEKQEAEAFFTSSLTLDDEGYGIGIDFDQNLYEKA